MSPLEFAFQPCVEEATVGCLGNLCIFLTRSKITYHPCTLAAAHSMFSPSFDLEIPTSVGIVGVEDRDASTTCRVYQISSARNHRHGPVALDLTIYEVVQHVDNEHCVSSILVIDMWSY